MTRRLIATILLALLGGAVAPAPRTGVITRSEALATVSRAPR